ncbi:oxygenase MpaB family protein [Amycolatopsis sp. NPDC051061]|uniref:oxygenase MpaB family protein n=1 Tax=Amycolatopsis sp. NPDC051061 TaxID=3155042 RepID=UPI003412CA51
MAKDEVNRRLALKRGGALGVLGAVTVASPALWTWPAAASVARTGAGADPRWVWDPEADVLLASVIDRGDVPTVNALLRTWKKNGQALPGGLPADVRDFVERARQLPSWTDQGKLAKSFAFTEKRGLYLGVLYGLASGMMSTVIPHEARAVYYSKGGAAMKDRISKTAKLGYDVMTRNAFAADGEMIVTCVKTRLVHAAVRHLLPQSPQWTGTADQTVPISQRDMLVTWHSLPTTVMGKLTSWEVPIPRAESDGFLHSWQLTAHLLGIMDEYIPASWPEANSQAEQILTPVLAPTDEGLALADILLNLGSTVDGGVLSTHVLGAFTRFMLGDRIADGLRIPREPVWDPLLDVAWGPFIAVREGLLPFPLAPAAYWTFDEFLRQAALLFLSEGKPISIEIPDANRPS